MNILWHMPTLQSRGCGLSHRAMRLAEQLARAGHTLEFIVEAGKTDLSGDLPFGRLTRVPIDARTPMHWSLQQLARSAAARAFSRQVLPSHNLFISCQPEMIDGYKRMFPDRPCIFVCGGTTLLHDAAQHDDQKGLAPWSQWPFAIDRLLRQRAESAGFGVASAVVFDSQHTRELVTRTYGINPPRAFTVYGGVDIDHFRPPTSQQRTDARASLNIKRDARVLVWTGRLAPEKNLDLLIDAVTDVPIGNLVCLLVGDGPLRTELEARVQAVGLAGRITFAGLQTDIRPYLHAADIFVFPSRGESFGCALAEAMACGLACIAAKSDGEKIQNASAELITRGRNGLLYEGSDQQALRTALAALLEDDKLRVDLGREARRSASQFDWRTAGERLNAICRAVVARPLARSAATKRVPQLSTLDTGA